MAAVSGGHTTLQACRLQHPPPSHASAPPPSHPCLTRAASCGTWSRSASARAGPPPWQCRRSHSPSPLQRQVRRWQGARARRGAVSCGGGGRAGEEHQAAPSRAVSCRQAEQCSRPTCEHHVQAGHGLHAQLRGVLGRKVLRPGKRGRGGGSGSGLLVQRAAHTRARAGRLQAARGSDRQSRQLPAGWQSGGQGPGWACLCIVDAVEVVAAQAALAASHVTANDEMSAACNAGTGGGRISSQAPGGVEMPAAAQGGCTATVLAPPLCLPPRLPHHSPRLPPCSSSSPPNTHRSSCG